MFDISFDPDILWGIYLKEIIIDVVKDWAVDVYDSIDYNNN